MSNPSQSAENAGAGAAAQDRRTNARYTFSASAEAVHLAADTRLNGRVSDLSRGGCYVDTINPFPVGAEIKIRIVKDNATFVAQATVLYSTSGMGMGLAFTEIDPERQRVLDGWLAELSGEARRAVKVLEDEVPVMAAASAGHEQRYVLNELIVLLIRKQVLTDAEGKALLKKLLE
jgi:PilZ domain